MQTNSGAYLTAVCLLSFMCFLLQSCAVCMSNHPLISAQKNNNKRFHSAKTSSGEIQSKESNFRLTQGVGRFRSRSQSELCKSGLAFSSFPIHAGAGCVWLHALPLWAGTTPGTLSNSGKKTAFLGINKAFWNCFQPFPRTVGKYPISICRFPLLL